MLRRHFLAGVVGLTAMCAAAALMVGVGQAEAAVIPATTSVYDVRLTLESSDLLCHSDCTGVAPDAFAGLNVGDSQQGVLTIHAVDAFQLVVDFAWPGGILAQGVHLYALGNNKFWNTLYDEINLDFANGRLSGLFIKNTLHSSGTGSIEQLNNVSFVEVAPVPLPMAGTLLPVGIGALAVMRKRRKHQVGTV